MKLDSNGWPMTSDTERRIKPGDMLWHVTRYGYERRMIPSIEVYCEHRQPNNRDALFIGRDANGAMYEDEVNAIAAFEAILEIPE